MRAYFVTQLRAVFEASPSIDENFHAKVGVFLDEVELFIDLILAIRDLPDTPEWKEELVAATYRLMEFIKRVGRTDLYIRFVHQLFKITVDSQDWLGAGLALRLHAALYPWSREGDLVDAFEHGGIKLPVQTQFARRESLYYHAIDYFGA
jgi:dedicator of cytokinesis protein 3